MHSGKAKHQTFPRCQHRRRPSLLLALMLNALMSLASAFSASLKTLVLLRLLAGVGVGGSMPVVFSLLGEMVPAHARCVGPATLGKPPSTRRVCARQ